MLVIYLRRELPHDRSVLPSIVGITTPIEQAILSRWYTRTCSLQPAQRAGHPYAWWSFTPPSHPYRLSLLEIVAVVFFCRHLLLPTTSISEVESLMLPGLSSRTLVPATSRRTDTAKVIIICYSRSTFAIIFL